MAYMSQEKKAKLAPAIKAACAKYGVKASIGVRNHSTLVLNIKSSPIDFIGNYNAVESVRNACRPAHMRDNATGKALSVNPYWYTEHFAGAALAFLEEVITAMNVGNHDNSDIQSDYFDVGWYVNVNVGAWNKPYVLAGN